MEFLANGGHAGGTAGRAHAYMGMMQRARPATPIPARPGPAPRSRSRLTRVPRAPLAALAVAAVLAGCVSPQQLVANQEGMLAAAGFQARPANTAERQAMLGSLPPDRVVSRPEGDRMAYLFADPLVCQCLYVGGPQEWSRYQAILVQQRIADQQVLAAQMNYDSWSWGPWGGFGFGPGFY